MQLEKAKETKQDMERCRLLAQRIAEELAPATAAVLNAETPALEKALHRAGVDANPFTVAARQADLLVAEDPAWVEMPAQMPGQVLLVFTGSNVAEGWAEELARQKQQAAQAAYDKNMGYLNEAYANRSNLLQQNYNDALAQLQASYDSGARGVNRNADSAQQQAYINYMMSKRDLPQALAAQGLTGGMSESALAGMYNSYGNNRNTIDRGRNESLATLLDTLNSNRSSALQSYNSQLSAAEQQKMAYQMQLEQALANGSAEILQNKYDTLQNLDNAYAQQILALQQAAAQAAQKRW